MQSAYFLNQHQVESLRRDSEPFALCPPTRGQRPRAFFATPSFTREFFPRGLPSFSDRMSFCRRLSGGCEWPLHDGHRAEFAAAVIIHGRESVDVNLVVTPGGEVFFIGAEEFLPLFACAALETPEEEQSVNTLSA
jgi:hypothetical protein